jgi:hypothetical protein
MAKADKVNRADICEPRKTCVADGLSELYTYLFIANVLAVVNRSAVGRAVRICGKYRVWIGVCLSDDCYRSVAVLGEGNCESAPAGITKEHLARQYF